MKVKKRFGPVSLRPSASVSWLMCTSIINLFIPRAPVPAGFKAAFRKTLGGTVIAAGGFTREIAETALEADELDLVAFGVPYIANPDLVERMQNGWPLAESDRTTY